MLSVNQSRISLSLWLSFSLSLSIERPPVSKVVEIRLVEAGARVDSGVVVGVGVVGLVEESRLSVGAVENSGLSISISLWLSLSFSLGDVDSSDRVSEISASGSVGLVGSNGGGGDIAGGLVDGVDGLAGVAGVPGGEGGGLVGLVGPHGPGVAQGGVAGVDEALVAVGTVEQGGVSLGSSEGSATDLSQGERIFRKLRNLELLYYHNSNPDHGSSSTFQ